MLSLSPAKILVVLVVALIVLGPDKLPGVARQIGALWGDLRKWRTKLESEVRGVFPDLPPTHHLTQAVRSPMSLLDRLADEHDRSAGTTGTNGSSPPGPAPETEPPPDPGGPGQRAVSGPRAPAAPAADDPSMN